MSVNATYLAQFIKSPIVRNVATIATGTAAAQAINMAFAPIITRLYGPDVFGVLGVFMAIASIVTPIAALTYPIAIVLPNNDADAKGLVKLSLYITVLLTIFMTFILGIFKKPLASLLKIEVIEPYLYLIPIVMFFATCLEVTQQWLIRKKQFKITAKVSVVQALILNSAKVGVGWHNPVAAALIILATLGGALHAFILATSAKWTIRSQLKEENTTIASMLELANRHRDFPFFRAPQLFINTASQGLPVFMLTGFVGPAAAGFYSIGRTVLGIPSLLIGKSVDDVFYPRIAEAAHKGENLTRLIIRATLALAAVGVVPFGIVVAIGPWIFGVVFGVEWVKAGEYARWLALWLFFGFINRPSVLAIPILKIQFGLLVYEIFSTTLKLMALLIGFYLFSSDILAVALFSVSGVFSYLFLIIWVINSSKKWSHLKDPFNRETL